MEPLFRLRDAFLPPGLLSLARVPLAICFPLFVERPLVALALLFAAGFSDVLDGFVARHFAMVTSTGSILDAVTDKVFVLTVATTLVAARKLAPTALLLLSTREVGELCLLLWLARSGHSVEKHSANAAGKIATFLQFIAVALALFDRRSASALAAVAAIAGIVAAVSYWRRALRVERTHGAR